MNLSVAINTREGDRVIVSLASSYPFISELLSEGMPSFEILEVSIFRESGSNPIRVDVFGKIAEILISIAEDNPQAILFYFCDIVEGIPRTRPGKKIPSHEYRNQLFKSLFRRYSINARESWSDIEVVLKSTDPQLEMYAHFLVRERHLPLIDILKKEVQNNFAAIAEQK